MDVGYFYVGFGLPAYRYLTGLSIKTVRKAMPDATVWHWTDKYTPPLKGADAMMRFDLDVVKDILITAKAMAMARYGMDAKRPWALSDVDVVWQKDIAPLYEGDWDVGLMWRGNPAMPINAGLVLSKPTEGAKAFWEKFTMIVHALPRLSDGWWSEQLAFAVMVGGECRPGETITTGGGRARIFSCDEIFPAVNEMQRVHVPGYAVHFKGTKAKEAMSAYAHNLLNDTVAA